ncbi:MAG: phage tail sheath family protein [Frankiaceae bacterium]|nr:phage tail sheath family protein [Frankiaceae bacterium]MBV9368429.1 phage tail sheath family protein [Frankiales bacterium]
MTVSPTYPGVYLTETASIPHNVVPATTNLTAFVGAYAKGPVGRAVLVSTWPQFEALYGGVVAGNLASYAVWQFFQNGGVGAWIVRITPGGNEDAATATVSAGGLELTASSPGAWGDALSVGLTTGSVSVGGAATPVATLTTTLTTASGASTVETLTNLPAASLGALAAAIDQRSRYVTAGIPSGGDATAAPTAFDRTALAGGGDGTWTEASFVASVEAALGFGADPSPLDTIAPQVFNLLAVPDLALVAGSAATYGTIVEFCAKRQAFALVDPPLPPGTAAATLWPSPTPAAAGTSADALTWAEPLLTLDGGAGAMYYPWLQIPDPANGQRPVLVPPSGSIAGVYAATDIARGVWKAPAGTAAALVGVTGLADPTIDDTTNGILNVAGVNCVRAFPVYGTVVWGARTLAGNDLLGSPSKYVPVRRLTDFIEQSLEQSLRWAVFEPNSAPLWASITLEVTSFMQGLFAEGAFAGSTAAAAYTVVCDATTTTSQDMLEGIVNVNVGFAPVDPAEFVMLNIQIRALPAS